MTGIAKVMIQQPLKQFLNVASIQLQAQLKRMIKLEPLTQFLHQTTIHLQAQRTKITQREPPIQFLHQTAIHLQDQRKVVIVAQFIQTLYSILPPVIHSSCTLPCMYSF